MSRSHLPEPVRTFLDAARTRDAGALRSAFASGAVVLDRGERFEGEAVSLWSERRSGDGRLCHHVIDVVRRGRLTHVIAMMEDAPPNRPLQHDMCFEVSDHRITKMVIDRSVPVPAPAPVAEFVLAMNRFALDEFASTFCEDALVNDQLTEHWGRDEIRRWAERDVVGQMMTIRVMEVIEHHEGIILRVNADGDYDKRGLPDPLRLTLYFQLAGNLIARLIILRASPD